MGMDNRKGAFWLQLQEHYERMGYASTTTTTNDDDDRDGDGGEEDAGSSHYFDPSRFSLCYDRQPLSSDLRSGIGSGALTLGGSDPLVHDTPMVFASNATPLGGWYNVRVRAMFLRTNGGTLLREDDAAAAADDVAVAVDDDDARYLRVHASEDALNGGIVGVIVDSGTTDTYLPLAVGGPFLKAWKVAVGSSYDNEPSEMTPEEVKSLPTILLVLRGHGPSNAANVARGAVGMTISHAGMFDPENNPTDGDAVDPVSGVDVVVAIPPGHYMEESSRSPGTYTSRVYFTERAGAQSILGSNFLMGHEVMFDNGRGRIGFAESRCDYSSYGDERDATIQQQVVDSMVEDNVDVIAPNNTA
jgi:hypothetical protein